MTLFASSPTALPRVSVIVPAHNAAGTLGDCLQALLASSCEGMEILVVDDRSTDGTAEIARSLGVRVVSNSRGRGPAAARNEGVAHARGALVMFIDADVLVQPDTVEQACAILARDPNLAAVFGSYDDEPSARNFLSQYKNLFHHFVHQSANEESVSFWGGCGAIRKSVFQAVGGFDEHRYPRPSTEDIELGMRLWKRQHRVRLDKALQVKHLKRWHALGLLKTEIFQRAYPWSKLIVSGGDVPDDLNLRMSHRISAASVCLLGVMAPFLLLGHRRFYGIPVAPLAGVIMALLVANVIVLNREFYAFLVKRRGWFFALLALPLHFFYYLYSATTFALYWLYHTATSPFSSEAPPQTDH